MPTTLTTIPSDIIQAHILPRLDGPSLSTTATVSAHLQHLCSDDSLWADVTKSMWPSITHPRVQDVISTFTSGHRSFFSDSFPALFTDVRLRRHSQPPPSTTVPLLEPISAIAPSAPISTAVPPEFISVVDIRYRNDVVYSAVQFTNTSPDFLSSELRIGFSNDPICNPSGSGSKLELQNTRPIDVEVDELAGAPLETLSDLEKSVTLSWIIIDPTRKRAGNLSSIKPVSVRQDWMGNETVLRFVTVLPGSDPDEMVQCKIRVVLGVNIGTIGLQVKHVGLKLEDLSYRCLNGREFLIILQGAILEENNVRRKVLYDKERLRSYREFKERKKEIKEWEIVEEDKREFNVKINYLFILVSFLFSIYFMILLLQ